MCRFFSCIVTREGIVYHNAEIDDSHNSILARYELRDDTAERTLLEFCRVEITPPDDRWDVPLNEWQLRIDEEIMPTWWNDGYALFVRDALHEFANERIVDAGEHSFENGRVWASGSALVEAWGSASVKAWGSASVKASDSVLVKASDSALVEASGSALVEAWGSASVKAWGSASVEASGSASVKAWGSASVKASGSATVKASGSALVEASGLASVEASGSASVKAWDSVSVILHNDAVCRRADTFYLSKESKLKFKRVTRVKA